MRAAFHPSSAARELEHRLDLLSEHALTLHSRTEIRIVQLSTAHLANAIQHLFLSIGEVLFQPPLEQLSNSVWQTHHHIARVSSPRLSSSPDDRRDFMIR